MAQKPTCLMPTRCSNNVYKPRYKTNICFQLFNTARWICYVFLILLPYASDTELNPDQNKKNPNYKFSLCHWNLYSILAHDFSKLSLLDAYNIQHKSDISWKLIWQPKIRFKWLEVNLCWTIVIIKETESVFISRNFWPSV